MSKPQQLTSNMLIHIPRHLMIWKAEGRRVLGTVSGNATKPQLRTISTNEHFLQTKQPTKPTERKNLHNTRYSLRSILPKGAKSLRGPLSTQLCKDNSFTSKCFRAWKKMLFYMFVHSKPTSPFTLRNLIFSHLGSNSMKFSIVS